MPYDIEKIWRQWQAQQAQQAQQKYGCSPAEKAARDEVEAVVARLDDPKFDIAYHLLQEVARLK